MTTRYDACTGRKDKNGKTYWTKIGAAFPAKEGKEGFNIVLDALPMPNAEGQAWISLFVPKPKDNAQTSQSSPPADDMNGDDIPF
jgi:hypothetical protein